MEHQKNIPQDLSDLRYRIRNSVNGTNKVKLGKFILIQRLGGGNYGDVYLAIHQETQKNFAIKIIDKNALFQKNRDPYVREVLTRLLKSQGILMQMCNSPHVVKCYDIIQNQRYKIFVMEYCNKGSLHDQLKKKKAYPVADALAIMKQMILGLSELHRNCIIHRDLKAQNIMIHNNKFKIADFGFSKKLDNENTTGQFTVLGTKTTMAPQVRGNKRYGIKADIWSLGIIFYTMICSNISFEADGYIGRPRDIHQQIFKKKEIFFMTVDGKPDEQLKGFIKSMLTIDPKQRISWKQLINHPIFNRTQSVLLSNVIQNIPIQTIPTTIMLHSSNEDQFDKKQTQYEAELPKQLPKQDALKQTKQKQKQKSISLQVEDQIKKQLDQTIDVDIATISSMTQFNKLKKSDVQEKLFKLIQQNNLQCHKAQYIYQKIILQIQKKQLLDLKRRSHNQLLCLLINRCFINVSWANNNLKQNLDNQMFVNYHTQVLELYKKIKAKWNAIQQNLRQVGNSKSYIFKDGFDSIFSRQKKKNTQIILCGIETKDYTKQQQLQFTQNQYIQKIIAELKANKHHQLPYEIQLKLKCYKKINQISLQYLDEKGVTFYQRVKQILVG